MDIASTSEAVTVHDYPPHETIHPLANCCSLFSCYNVNLSPGESPDRYYSGTVTTSQIPREKTFH